MHTSKQLHYDYRLFFLSKNTSLEHAPFSFNGSGINASTTPLLLSQRRLSSNAKYLYSSFSHSLLLQNFQMPLLGIDFLHCHDSPCFCLLPPQTTKAQSFGRSNPIQCLPYLVFPLISCNLSPFGPLFSRLVSFTQRLTIWYLTFSLYSLFYFFIFWFSIEKYEDFRSFGFFVTDEPTWFCIVIDTTLLQTLKLITDTEIDN